MKKQNPIVVLILINFVFAKVDNQIYDKYYSSLISSIDNSPEYKINLLKNHIFKNPGFAPAYIDLLDNYLFLENEKQAQEFFFNISKDSSTRNIACWMLAKIQTLNGNIEEALSEYKIPLKNGFFSSILLWDLAYFSYLNNVYKQILSILKTKKQKIIFNLIYKFVKYHNKESSDLFNTLPDSLKKDPLVLYVNGYNMFNLGDSKRACKLFNMSLAEAKKKGDKVAQIECLFSLGYLEMTNRDFSSSHKYYGLALQIGKLINNKRELGYIYGNLGRLLISEEKYDSALVIYNLAIEHSMKFFENEVLSRWYFGKAQALYYMNRLSKVMSLLSLAEDFAYKAKARNLIPIKINKGDFFNKLNLPILAKSEYESGFKIADEMRSNSYRIAVQSKIALVYYKEKEYKKARKIFQNIIESQASNSRTDMLAYWHLMIGETFRFENLFDEAENEYLLAKDIAESGKSMVYKIYADLKLANLAVKHNNLALALELLNNIEKPNGEFSILYNKGLGDIYKAQSEFDSAISYFVKAIDTIEATRDDLSVEQLQIGYFSNADAIYKELIDCYYNLYTETKRPQNLDSLYHFIEMNRARTIKEINIPLAVNTKNQAFEDYRDTSKKLSTLQRTLRNNPILFDSLSQELKKARNSLILSKLRLQNSTKYRENKTTKTLIQIQKEFQNSNYSMILYNFSNKNSFALTLNNRQKELVKLNVNLNLLKASIDSMLIPLHNVTADSLSSLPFYANISHRLYRQLIAPIENKIKLNDVLIIVPDPYIMGLPFEMLLSKKQSKNIYYPPDNPTYAKDFLIKKYAITNAPSTWIVTNKKSLRDSTMLIIANPFKHEKIYSNKQKAYGLRSGWILNPLLYAEKEANLLNNIIPKVKILSGNKATKMSFFKHFNNFNILHFATHSILDTIFDAFSGLVLASSNDSTDDGLFMGYEISDLSLNCDLVNLSACETGRGNIVSGEGVLGLPRLFLRSGARRVIMSHWKVDDKFTSEMMPTFYDNYLLKNMSKTEALRKAKLKYLTEKITTNTRHYKHPFYWASFSLYGSPEIEDSHSLNLYYIFILLVLAALIYYYFFKGKTKFFLKLRIFNNGEN